MNAKIAGRLVIGFACAGHASMHILTGLYLTLVLVIERVWARPYDELIGLWTLGAMMIGLGAPLAGWLSDRYGERRLMILFFLLTGGGSILTGLADDTNRLWIALAVLGLGASIYHPVALAWVVRHSPRRRGMVMGIWGISGSLGVAVASVIAGTLADFWSWQTAFIVPGGIVVAIGVALMLTPDAETSTEAGDDAGEREPPVSRGTMVRAFGALTAAMFLGGVFYAVFTTMLPKWLNATMFGGGGELDASNLGAIVTTVYLAGALAQIVGGYLTDRVPLKVLYVASFVIKLPLPFLAAIVGGWPAALLAAGIIFFLDFGAPVENVLVARYAPDHRRGLIYGLKFVLAFASGPIGVQMVAWFYDLYGDFHRLLMVMGAMVVAMLVMAMLLPSDRTRPVAATASA